MANAKRASMREGPLAALFRKTEGTEDEQATAAAEQPRAGAPPSRARERTADAAPRIRARAACRTRRSAPPRRRRAEPAHVPSPQERLRHAFSSEIPENVMDRPAPARPVMDDYAREHPAAAGPPDPPDSP